MTRVPQDPLRPGRTRRKWPMVDSIQGYNISKNCDDASPRFFCEARFNMRILRFFGLIQRDLSGPLRPGKKSGHGLLQYSFQGTIYAKSVMTQVLVILGGFSENRLSALTRFSGCRIWGVLPSSPTACRHLMETPNCWYDQYLWYMSKLRWRKS